MKKNIFLLFIFSMLFFISCGDDEPDTPAVPAPTSDFSFEIDGKNVTFTDASKDATSYLWDFGDGNTSTESSPTHTYAANGSYVAKLTAENSTGTDSKQAVLEIINVGIDGDFSDWDDVEVAITPSAGTIKNVKFENLENNKLFIYVEGTEDLTPQTQIIINSDNDITTGANISWWYLSAGEDLLIEGSLPLNDAQEGFIYFCEPCDGSAPGDWNWAADPNNSDIASFMEASEMVSIPGGFAYELAVDLTALGVPVSNEAIGIAVMDVDLETWAPVGSAPDFINVDTNPEANPYIYTFK